MKNRTLLLAALAATLPAREASAQRWSVNVGAGGDVSLAPAARGFGIAVADFRLRDVARGDLRVTFNTDTLQVGLENVALTPWLQLNVAARGELFFAGMLQHFYVRGEELAPRGYNASYAQLLASLKLLPAQRHSVELVASWRAWFFGAREGSAFVPGDTYAFEPRARYVYWDLRAPRGDTDPAIFHPRFEGIALGVELGMDLRPADVTRAVPLPFRSQGLSNRVLFARQWLRAGVRAHRRVRLQFEQSAAFGDGEDDLSRVRVGGMNPYSVQIPGLPWPALLSERLVAGLAGVHWQVAPRAAHEVGLALAAGAFCDPGRTGDLDRYGLFAGTAVFGDLRWGAWVVHLRAGLAFPSAWLDRGPHANAFASVSHRWN